MCWINQSYRYQAKHPVSGTECDMGDKEDVDVTQPAASITDEYCISFHDLRSDG